MRRLNGPLMLVASVTFAAACIVPAGQVKDPAAEKPHGTMASLILDRRTRITGELLEMRDTAYVVLTEREIVLVPFRIVARAVFTQEALSYRGSRPYQQTLRQLRLRSRFPQGMSPEILAKLLALKGQTSLTVATRA